MCQPVEGRLTLRLDQPPRRVSVCRLNAAGLRGKRVPYQLAGRELSFTPDAEYQTLYYEVVLRF